MLFGTELNIELLFFKHRLFIINFINVHLSLKKKKCKPNLNTVQNLGNLILIYERVMKTEIIKSLLAAYSLNFR